MGEWATIHDALQNAMIHGDYKMGKAILAINGRPVFNSTKLRGILCYVFIKDGHDAARYKLLKRILKRHFILLNPELWDVASREQVFDMLKRRKATRVAEIMLKYCEHEDMSLALACALLPAANIKAHVDKLRNNPLALSQIADSDDPEKKALVTPTYEQELARVQAEAGDAYARAEVDCQQKKRQIEQELEARVGELQKKYKIAT